MNFNDSEVVSLVESLSNAHGCSGFEDETLEAARAFCEPFATIEERFGKRIGHSNARYAARVAGRERGAVLGVPAESPVLHLEQQIFLTDNTSAEWSNVWLSANKYVVGTVLQRI